MSSKPEKSVDVPPRGDRNADPITDQPGAHPVEVGVGAAAAGAAAGVAAGAVGGPVGAAIGAVAGAVAGGLLGKAGGEYIDPTLDDTYLRDNFKSRPYVKEGDTFDTYVPAYQYGGRAEATYGDKPYAEVEPELMTGWPHEDTPWEHASPAVRDGYERSCAIRKLAGKG
jgi:uncharacterized protein YcfJ